MAAQQSDEAALQQAELNLSYTVIRAPVDGAVGDRGLRLGQYVQPGTALMQIVPMGRDLYVVANFKETQLRQMGRGEAVTVDVDTFPGHSFHGSLDSLAPGSGSQFALLPPENATGNFTKIVQRVPVKIHLADDPWLDRLRPGLSVEATVDTRTGAARSAADAGGRAGHPAGKGAGSAKMSGSAVAAPAGGAAKVSLRDWIAVFGAVLGAFMAVLDIQITNSSLQDIQGGLAASLDEGSWISTAYLVAEIVVIPLTGWLSQAFSMRRYLLVNCALFLRASRCSAAWPAAFRR